MNPDYIPPQYGIPLIIILWLILFVMILRERRRLNKALKERPSLKILNRQTGEWVDYNSPPPQEVFDQEALPTPPKGSSA